MPLNSVSEHRCAMMFAHPGHELLAAGLMQRYRPHLLFLTCADSAGEAKRENLARHGLEQLDLNDRTTFLGISEFDLYGWLLAGAIAPFLDLRDRLLQWLAVVRPTLLFGDAFELYNVVHDTGRALLDSAWREYRQRSPCANFELPLVCRTEPQLWNLRFQEFPSGSCEAIVLSDAERGVKKSLADWAAAHWVEAEVARPFCSLDREAFRQVSADRDYTKPPEGLRLHYDDWGRLKVQMKKYQEPILFEHHFVPLIRQLPLL